MCIVPVNLMPTCTVSFQTHTVPHVSLDVRQLDFGRIPDPRAVEQKV